MVRALESKEGSIPFSGASEAKYASKLQRGFEGNSMSVYNSKRKAFTGVAGGVAAEEEPPFEAVEDAAAAAAANGTWQHESKGACVARARSASMARGGRKMLPASNSTVCEVGSTAPADSNVDWEAFCKMSATGNMPQASAAV